MSEHVRKKSLTLNYMAKEGVDPPSNAKGANAVVASSKGIAQQPPAPAPPPPPTKEAQQVPPAAASPSIPEDTKPKWCLWDTASHVHSQSKNVISMDVIPTWRSPASAAYMWTVAGPTLSGIMLLTSYRPNLTPLLIADLVVTESAWTMQDDVGLVFYYEKDIGILRVHKLSHGGALAEGVLPKDVCFAGIPSHTDICLFANCANGKIPKMESHSIAEGGRCTTPDSTEMRALATLNGELSAQTTYMVNAIEELNRQRFLKRPHLAQAGGAARPEASMMDMLKKQHKVNKSENEHLHFQISQWSGDRMADLHATLKLRDKELLESQQHNKGLKLTQRVGDKNMKSLDSKVGEANNSDLQAEEEIRRLETFLAKMEKEADRNRKSWDMQQTHINKLAPSAPGEEQEREGKHAEKLRVLLAEKTCEEEALRKQVAVLTKVSVSEAAGGKRDRLQNEHAGNMDYLRTQIAKVKREIDAKTVIINENRSRPMHGGLPPLDEKAPPDSPPEEKQLPPPRKKTPPPTKKDKDGSFWKGLRNGEKDAEPPQQVPVSAASGTFTFEEEGSPTFQTQ